MPRKKAPRINRKFLVEYEPTDDGLGNGIEAGIQGEFESLEEAQQAARLCHKWFNTPTVLEPAEDAQTGRTVMVKRKEKLNMVKIRIDEYVDDELVKEGIGCGEESSEPEKKRATKSSREPLAVGSA